MMTSSYVMCLADSLLAESVARVFQSPLFRLPDPDIAIVVTETGRYSATPRWNEVV